MNLHINSLRVQIILLNIYPIMWYRQTENFENCFVNVSKFSTIKHQAMREYCKFYILENIQKLFLYAHLE